MISLKQLRYFEAVARIRHFGRAAEQCAVTQPALSMQIQELEKTLGVQLVERGRNGVRLTEAVREVARRATPILAEPPHIAHLALPPGPATACAIRRCRSATCAASTISTPSAPPISRPSSRWWLMGWA